MAQPSNLLLKLSRRLLADPSDQAAFVQALTEPQPLPTALVWTQPRPADLPFVIAPPLPWQPAEVDRLSPDQRPGQHDLHAAGAYYCLDTASVFAAAVLDAIAEPVNLLLDLCAAPGGKSLLAWQRLHPQRLWCNEVIRKRVKILIANLKRCGATDSLVFNLDPRVFAEQVPQAADVVIVDAPCSGQSLLAKGDTALGCFHPVNINKNASRQRRILGQAAQTVAGGGYLAYMTCTFSPKKTSRSGHGYSRPFPSFKPWRCPVWRPMPRPWPTFPAIGCGPSREWGLAASRRSFAMAMKPGAKLPSRSFSMPRPCGFIQLCPHLERWQIGHPIARRINRSCRWRDTPNDEHLFLGQGRLTALNNPAR